MRTGTNNFVNYAAALRYYEGQGYDEYEVITKIEEGAIVFGKPKVEDDEYLTTVDGRYFINTI